MNAEQFLKRLNKALADLPPLEESKTTREQIQLCFDAYHDPSWVVPFD